MSTTAFDWQHLLSVAYTIAGTVPPGKMGYRDQKKERQIETIDTKAKGTYVHFSESGL